MESLKAGPRNAGVEKPSRGRGYSSFSITQDLAASDATAYGTDPISPLGPTAETSASSNASMHVSGTSIPLKGASAELTLLHWLCIITMMQAACGICTQHPQVHLVLHYIQ